jgi:hypothetical protein
MMIDDYNLGRCSTRLGTAAVFRTREGYKHPLWFKLAFG